MHYSPAGSSDHTISQARILEWVAMPSSRGSSRPRDWTPSPALGRVPLNFEGRAESGSVDRAFILPTYKLKYKAWRGGSTNLHKTKQTFWEIKCQDLLNFLPGSKLLKHRNIWGEDRRCPWPNWDQNHHDWEGGYCFWICQKANPKPCILITWFLYNPQAMHWANWKTWLEKVLFYWVSVSMRYPHLNMTRGVGCSSNACCAMPQASISSIPMGWTLQDLMVLWSTRDQ